MLAPMQVFGQTDRPVAHPYQAAYGAADGIEQAPDNPVSPLADNDPVPAIETFATGKINLVKACRTVLQGNALPKFAQVCPR